MIHILQINMPRNAIAHELLTEFVAESKADLVLISEQYQNKDPASWHPDISGTAVIWVWDGTLLKVLTQGRGDGFVWIRCSGITIFSVYLTPNETMPDFRRRLDALEDAILGTDGRIFGSDLGKRPQYIAFEVVRTPNVSHPGAVSVHGTSRK